METKILRLLPSIADLLLDTVFAVDARGQIVYVSAACEPTFGYTREELVGTTLLDMVVPEDREQTLAEAARVLAGHARIGFENRYFRKDGSQVHIMWSARWSEVDGLRIGVARDITERKRAEDRQAAIHAVSEAANKAADLAELSGSIHQILAKLAPTAGLAIAIAHPRTDQLELAYRMDCQGGALAMPEAAMLQYCADAMRSGQPMQVSESTATGNTGLDGASWLVQPLINWKSAIGALIMKSHPGAAYSAAERELLQFVSAQVAAAIERWRVHAELLRYARYDDLTGLPNRRHLYDRMKAVLARSRRKATCAAVLFIDINRFKQVNDDLGHAVGDALLRKFAQRLQQCVREEDTVARLAGDEFVVLLEDVDAPGDAQAVADKIRSTCMEAVHIDGHALQARASIGVAYYPADGTETEQLLKHADEAMYRDKRLRRQDNSSGG